MCLQPLLLRTNGCFRPSLANVASVSSCGMRPAAAVTVHASAVGWAHANSEACARCPTTAFQRSATAPPYRPWSAGPPHRVHGPAFPLDKCATAHRTSSALQRTGVSGGVQGLAWEICCSVSRESVSAPKILTNESLRASISPSWSQVCDPAF